MLNEDIKNMLKELCKENGSAIDFDAPLALLSTVQIGGQAEILVRAQDFDGLKEIKTFLDGEDVPYKIIGKGSNVLFPDDKFETVVILLFGEAFHKVEFDGNDVACGAGAPLGEVISECASKGLSGMEGLVGIPGTIGGALFMNASYDSAISDNLKEVTVLDDENEIKKLQREDLEFGYRKSSLSQKTVVLDATFTLIPKTPADIEKDIKASFLDKMAKQPMEKKTLGCVFKNPESGELSSGALIDRAGMKGAFVGGAVVSEKHANFIVNSGGATGEDFRTLMGEVKDRVKEKFDVELEPEIEILA